MDNLDETQKLKALIETLPGGIGIYHVYTDGKIELVYLNDDYYSWIGCTREERTHFEGRSVMQALHPDDKEAVYKAALDAITKNNKTTVTCRIKCKNDSYRWVTIRIKPVSRKGEQYTVYALYTDIDELKRLQLQLEHNQQSVDLAQKQGDLANWSYNIDKHYIQQHSALEVAGHMGYPIIIKNVPACFVENNSVFPTDQAIFLSAYQQLEDGADAVDVIYRLQNLHSQKYDWVHMYYQRIYNEQDSDRMAVGFSIVINQQQENLERYYAERDLRKKIFSNAMKYYVFNLTKGIIESYEKNDTSDYSHQPIINQSLAYMNRELRMAVEEPYLEDIKRLYTENLLKSFQKGEIKVICEYQRKATAVSDPIWVRTTAIMAQRPDSNDVMAFVYVEDIDEEKKSRLTLESTMEEGIESIALIHVKDRVARTIKVNPLLDYIGLDKTFLYDDTFVANSKKVEINDNENNNLHRGELSDIIANLVSHKTYQYSMTIKSSNGDLKRKLFRYRYLDESKEDIVLSIADITELYKDERKQKLKLKQAVEEATSANKAKTDFLSRMSHDIRTPLNVIIGMTRLAQENENPTDTQNCLDKIGISSEFLLGLINDVLDMERIESGKIELHPVPYSGLEFKQYIETVIVPLCKEKNIEFLYTTDSQNDFVILQDKLRINQIYFNLLSNAVKFTPEGGNIRFHTKIERISDTKIALNATISDTGIGMSKAFLSHMYDAFSQENQEKDAVRQGTGLGLSIVKRLCDLMQMDISVQSSLGKGTTFYLHGTYTIADKSDSAHTLQIEPGDDDFSILKNKIILVCEDHMLNQEIIRRLLEHQGMVPVLKDDGKKGIEAFLQSAPGEYAAILMDIRMPVMDGLSATKKIRALDRADAKTIPIIAMTANAFNEDVEKSLEAGMTAHLAKPIEPEQLMKTLKKSLTQ